MMSRHTLVTTRPLTTLSLVESNFRSIEKMVMGEKVIVITTTNVLFYYCNSDSKAEIE